jgi:TolB-like protein/Tfp pilus assembly protein PilF
MAEERAERRLAAILAADVVGYSRLMERDEAGTLAALKKRRKELLEPLVDNHRGRIFKIAGDGVFIEFGSAVNAVQCAIEFQQGAIAANIEASADLQIEFRIGINLGDVIVEGDDLYGDGVNIAARLESIGEPGTVLLSGSAYDQVKNKIETGFENLGSRSLKNIAEPVRVYRAGPAGGAKRAATPLSDKPSIAVLPFVNLSGDPEQEYFSDGITEDIITELSRFRFLFVIARNSSFAYKGRALDAREIGRQLGVRYVVEGSIRRAGNRVRVTSQLIDSSTGSHLWAERYDRELADIFSVQDEVAHRIVTSVAPRIEAEGIDLAKRKPPEDMRAYDYFLRAKALIETPHDGTDMSQARAYCDRAIEIDSSYARAHAQRAFTYIIGIELMESSNAEEWRRQALISAEKAVALDPLDAFCHWALCEATLQAKQYDRALDHIARAATINPNDAHVLAVSGYVHAVTGDPETGLKQIGTALERNPYMPSWYHWLQGNIFYILGQYEEALRAFHRFSPPNSSVLKGRAVTLVELGRIDEARIDVRALLALRPSATVREARQFLGFMPDIEHYLDNLRRAGLPE